MNDCIGCKTRRKMCCKRVALTLCCCTFAVLLLVTAPACAFVSFGNGLGSKWGSDPTAGTPAVISWGFMNDGTTVDPNFVLDPFGFPGQTGLDGTSNIGTLEAQIDSAHGSGAFVSAIQRAFDTWSEVTNIVFFGPINDPGFPFAHPAATAPDIRIGAFLPEAGHSFETVGAVGFGPPGFGPDALAGDILFNLSATIDILSGVEDVTPIPFGTNDLEGLFLHELGHAAIGLGHPEWEGDPPWFEGDEPDQRVMYVGNIIGAAPCCQTINRELHEDDIAGAWFTYGIRGDHNGDGSADAADYTVWRDGNLSASQYDSWVDRFGAVRTQPTVNTGESVPEPSGLVMVALGLIGLVRRKENRQAFG